VISITIGSPFSANKMYTPSQKYGLVKSKKYKTWIENNLPLFELMDKPTKFPVEVVISVFGGRGFGVGSDVDNITKPIGDILVRAKVVPDDNYKFIEKYTLKFMDFWSQKGDAVTVISIIEPGD
jgi:hypothetical protein